jgi:ketosteroid isomerase-like protein
VRQTRDAMPYRLGVHPLAILGNDLSLGLLRIAEQRSGVFLLPGLMAERALLQPTRRRTTPRSRPRSSVERPVVFVGDGVQGRRASFQQRRTPDALGGGLGRHELEDRAHHEPEPTATDPGLLGVRRPKRCVVHLGNGVHRCRLLLRRPQSSDTIGGALGRHGLDDPDDAESTSRHGRRPVRRLVHVRRRVHRGGISRRFSAGRAVERDGLGDRADASAHRPKRGGWLSSICCLPVELRLRRGWRMGQKDLCRCPLVDHACRALGWETLGARQRRRAGRALTVEARYACARDARCRLHMPLSFVANNDDVMVFLRYGFTVTATGKDVATNLHHYFRLRDGKVAYVRVAEDTALIASAFSA